jgi:hypothetical protein
VNEGVHGFIFRLFWRSFLRVFLSRVARSFSSGVGFGLAALGFEVIGFLREAVREDEEGGDPEADEDAEAFSVGAVLFGGHKPSGNGESD